MPESSTPTDTSATSTEEAAAGTQTANGSSSFNLEALKSVTSTTDANAENAEQAPRRKVYESTLFADRKSRRAPSSIILGAIVVVAGVLAYVVYAPHPRRHVVTVGKMVYAAADTVGGASKLYLANVDGSGAQALAASTFIDDSPAFSPDGDQVAFISNRQGADRQVFLMDADGQNVQQVTRNSGSKSNPSFASWPGSRTIGFASGGTLFAADIAAGEIDQVFPPPPKDNSHGVGQGQTDTAVATEAKQSVRFYAFAPKADKDHQATGLVTDTGAGESLGILPSLSSAMVSLSAVWNGQKSAMPPAATVSTGWNPDGGLMGVAMTELMMPQMSKKAAVPEISGLFLADASGQIQRVLVGMVSTDTDKATLALLIHSMGFAQGQTALVQVPHHILGPAHPVFSPDGDQLYFELWDQTDPANRECKGLYKVSISGGQMPQLIIAGDVEDLHFTTDGKSMLYLTKRADGGHDLWSVGIDGTGQKRISDGKQDITDVAISPQIAHD